MKKNTAFYLMIFAVLFGLSSCATDARLKSYVVGNWQPVKLGASDIQRIIPKDDTLPKQYTNEDIQMLRNLRTSMEKKSPDGTVKRATREDFTSLLNEAGASYTFTSDGKGIRKYSGHLMNGKWKLKKKGKELNFTQDSLKDKVVLMIDSLSSKKMVATYKTLPKSLKITFTKVK